MIKLILQKSDALGILTSTLCIIHCLATPLIFIAHTHAINETNPIWWSNLDYIFLIISLLAVLRSIKNTSKNYMKLGLGLNWVTLFLLIINEKIRLVSLPEITIYVTAFSLAALHIYNMKYCQCKTNKCCIHNG
ncbi:MerC domain-containing protein [Aquimarina agarilytica]|uniref:MerC domain-containing protein n=1 Tax=Aquimarina agarilytica TaxID=1087449 RepID=UPI000288C622|nr:MerC domain-containing protein [Aquimarina agarilytica]